MPEISTISVLGLGYIGLPTASLLATKGFQVRGVDTQQHVVDIINSGNIHIKEPDLDVLVRSAVQSGYLTAATEPTPADVYIITVPTPFKDDHAPDLTCVEAASRSIAPYLIPGNLVILESTSPVGTTEQVAEWIRQERSDLDTGSLHIAHCPERVLPGQILKELLENDRIVGGIDEASTVIAADFYRSFVSGRVLTTDARTAELAKLAENTFRDVNIALANELSLVCDHLGVDVWELIRLANHHPRVKILNPGPGVGGHCLAVDPWFIVDSAPEQARLIRTSREVNDSKPAHVIQRVLAHAEKMKDPVIACFGLSYKADIDDLRESPALAITLHLAGTGIGTILVVEPYLDTIPESFADHHIRLVSLEEALTSADIIVGLVNHHMFQHIGMDVLDNKVVIDTLGIWREDPDPV